MQAILNEQEARGEETLWEAEYQQQLLHWAADRVRGNFEDSSWRAFWLQAVDGMSGKRQPRALSMTLAAVYMARVEFWQA